MSHHPDAPRPAHWKEIATTAGEIPSSAFHVTFPWADLRETYGPLLPGSVHIVSARTGSGKTLFVLNWIWALVGGREPQGVCYVPLETPAREVVQRLTCRLLDVDPARVLIDDFSQLASKSREEFEEAAAKVAHLVLAPGRGPEGFFNSPRLHLFDQPRMTIAQLRAAVTEAAANGARVAIIDHLLRLDLGNGQNLYAEVSAGIRAIKLMAEELGIAIVVTSQQSRQQGGDRLSWYAPPDLQSLKGAGTIEEEADGVLFLHRVLRDDLVAKELAEVRAGRLPLRSVVAPHLMACAVGKHRRDGSKVGGACRLWVERGRVGDLPAAERAAWEAHQQGIRTNRDLTK